MHKVHAFIGLLVFLAVSLSACSQDSEQAGDTPEQVPEVVVNDSQAVLGLPCDITYPSAAGDVCFPHKKHRKLGCSTCHHEIRAKALDTPHPDYIESSQPNCQTCHDPDDAIGKNDRSCTGCHHSEPEGIADETLSSKVVLHESCWKCHEIGTGVDASKECSECHAKKEK